MPDTPPTDAAVREALERIEECVEFADGVLESEGWYFTEEQIEQYRAALVILTAALSGGQPRSSVAPSPERDQRKPIEITDPITARYLGFDVPQSDIDAANAERSQQVNR